MAFSTGEVNAWAAPWELFFSVVPNSCLFSCVWPGDLFLPLASVCFGFFCFISISWMLVLTTLAIFLNMRVSKCFPCSDFQRAGGWLLPMSSARVLTQTVTELLQQWPSLSEWCPRRSKSLYHNGCYSGTVPCGNGCGCRQDTSSTHRQRLVHSMVIPALNIWAKLYFFNVY